MRFPRGIALIRLQQGAERITYVSPRLSHDQELAARILAFAQHGSTYIVVTSAALIEAMAEAAA